MNDNNFCKTCCNHLFHVNCLGKHIYLKNNNCPLCRKSLFEENYTTFEEEEEAEAEYDETTNTLDNKELIINKICNYLKTENIDFKDVITNLCFIEHDEFEKLDVFQTNSDYIYGKIRYIINKYPQLLEEN
jgi:hypothetical protein